MKISEYLKETGLSQMAFANSLGVTQGTVGFWLHNKPPTMERAIQIERVTEGKVTCEELRPDIDWAYLRGSQKEAA
jgi:DNA-binding transcriptional regulator YdaS (Cro superfamily)